MTTTPTTWLDSFQVNLNSVGFKGDQDIVGLSNGNFLVVFADDTNTIGSGAGRDIVGVIYNAEGTIVTTSFQVNTFGTADNEELPAIAATNDGGFVMVYEDRNAAGQQILIQRYDDEGTSIDTGFVQTDPGAEFVSNPKVAVNQADNSIFVTYQFTDVFDASVRGKRFDADLNVAAGTPTDGHVLRSDDFPSAFPGVSGNNTTVLTNGNFVTVFSEPDSAGASGDNIEFRISNGTTGANSILRQVSASGGDLDITPDVAALTGGGFVVVWREQETTTFGDDNGENILFARYNNSGTLQGSITTVVDTGSDYTDPAVIGLEDGGFFVAAYDSTINAIEGTRFDASGNQVGTNMFAIEGGVTNFPDIELSLTTDGRILLTYDDPSGDIQAEILDPRDAGTITAEAGDEQTTARATEDTTLIGVQTEGDTLFGQDGDDVIYGGDVGSVSSGAMDILYGGDGNDYLDGGLFRDDSFGGAGNDFFNISAGNAADDVFGGSGTDTLDFSASVLTGDVIFTGFGGGTYLSSLYTFAGIEVIIGNDDDRTWDLFFGAESVVAGSGNDTFVHDDGEDLDNLDAGGGIDTFDASGVTSVNQAITVNMSAGTFFGFSGSAGSPLTFLNFENFEGTKGGDTITGDNNDNTLSGNDGNDTINAQGGNDLVYGGDGNDTFNHDDGNDSWFGGAGNDTFNGLNFSEDDTIAGDSGQDTFSVAGSGSIWTLANNVATAGSQSTTLSSIEIFIGSNQNDDLDEGNGAINEFFGGGGNDILRTNGINNLNETFDGGTGTDTLDYSDETDDTTFDMTAGTLTSLGAAANFENAIGGSGNDDILGTSGANSISGGAGNDTLKGEDGNDVLEGDAGDDVLEGGAGNDTLDGGTGNDTLQGDGGSNTYIVADDGSTNSIDGSTSFDTIDVSGFNSGIFVGQNSSVGATGDYNLVSGNGTVIENANREAKTLVATDFDDEINEFNLDVIYGGAGNDVVIVYQAPNASEAYFGGADTDTLNLADGINSSFDDNYGVVNLGTGALTGTGGAFGFENVIGTEGDNTITGTSGANSIDGGAGNDTIISLGGSDALYGGDGNDTFVQGNGEVLDDIFGGVGNDTVDLSAELTNGVDADLDNAQTMTGLGGTVDIVSIESFIGTQASDTIEAGLTATIDGQGGDDTIIGDFSTQSLIGGSGNDTFINGNGEFVDDIDGGTGNDTVDMSADASNAVDANLGAETFTGLGGTRDLLSIENFIGTQANDTITGTTGANSIEGGSGTDTIEGGQGSDLIYGGDDNDLILDGSGISGGTDVVYAGDGDDRVENFDGFVGDFLDGGAGNDTLDHSGSGVFGNSIVNLETGQVVFANFPVNPSFDTAINFEHFVGDNLSETVTGTAGVNSISGNAGDDVIDAAEGNDVVYGGGDNDTIIGGAGADRMYGGADDDTADYSASGAGINVRLNGSGSSGGDAQGDRLYEIENVVGSNFADTITGNGAGNTLDGGGGSDSIIGSGDEDLLIGGTGGDQMRGNAGNDTLEGGANNDRLFGDEDEDMIFGGANNDRVFGGGDNDTIEGGDGDDELFGTLGADLIYGGNDHDLIAGNAGADFLYGGDGNDTVNGNEFADQLYGGANDDTLNGGSGLDELFGGNGEDVLNGGASSDQLTGGANADTFQFTVTGGIDRITDWQDGIDQLDFTADGLGFGDFTVSTFGGGAGAKIVGGGYVVFFEGIATTDIDATDFL